MTVNGDIKMKKKKANNEKNDSKITKNSETSIKKKKPKKFMKNKIKKDLVKVSDVPTSSSEFSSNWKAFLEQQKREPKVKEKGINKRNESVKRRKHFEPKPKEDSHKNPIWFDVDPLLLEQECGVKSSEKKNTTGISNETSKSETSLKTPKLNDETVVDDPEKITKYVAIDCEMVGIGFEGKENALARVSLVNSNCECIYDKFVKPSEKVVDYRTAVSGVRPSDLKNAPCYEEVQKEVADILNGRILVGHALQNDLKCLMLGHSRKQIRDTSKYHPFHKLLGTNRPALRKLVAKILQVEIQTGEHSSVIDARATMKIFKLYRKEWEKSLRGIKRLQNSQEIFMGGEDRKTQRKNKWKKIKQKKKKED